MTKEYWNKVLLPAIGNMCKIEKHENYINVKLDWNFPIPEEECKDMENGKVYKVEEILK